MDEYQEKMLKAMGAEGVTIIFKEPKTVLVEHDTEKTTFLDETINNVTSFDILKIANITSLAINYTNDDKTTSSSISSSISNFKRITVS